MKKNIFLMFALVFTLASCGGGSSSTSEISSSRSKLRVVNLGDLKAALNRQLVVCGEAGLSCPGFAGKLTFWEKGTEANYLLGVCSGSLYNGKYLITNSHCIPKNLAYAGASCSDQINVLFPTTKYFHSESAKCKSIVQVFNPALEQTDLAVIELDRTIIRDSVEIAKDGFIEGSNVTAFTMNPAKDDDNLGTITKKNCILSTDNAFFMTTDHSAPQAVISGSNCEVIHGNSGSGLLNKNGKLIAAINMTMEQDRLVQLFAKNQLNYTVKVPMGVVQNITCLMNVTANEGSGCDLSSPRIEDFNDFITRSIQAQNLAAVPETQLEYEVTNGFKLKLKEVAVAQTPNDLQSFRSTWSKIFFKNSNTSDVSKLLRYLSREK
ncbi:MAG: trypsin-like peptidase domain-containing protein [Bacteriovorax sp.]|nr:trypsin-like peptidase domain-containing protein [Bacteriovorax sp.]